LELFKEKLVSAVEQVIFRLASLSRNVKELLDLFFF